MQINLGKTLTSFSENDFSISLERGQFRHAWVIGKSGIGKSTPLRNIATEIMREGYGLAIIEPHSDLVYDVFNHIPQPRLEDIVYIGPESDRAPDIGLFNHPDKERASRTS